MRRGIGTLPRLVAVSSDARLGAQFSTSAIQEAKAVRLASLDKAVARALSPSCFPQRITVADAGMAVVESPKFVAKVGR